MYKYILKHVSLMTVNLIINNWLLLIRLMTIYIDVSSSYDLIIKQCSIILVNYKIIIMSGNFKIRLC